MAFKFVCFAALLAIARAGNIAAPVAYAAAPLLKAAPLAALPAVPVAKAVAAVDTEYDPHPQYNYAYDIQDAITGDNKGHQEIRDGDVVQGRYFLIDADGTRRTVEYTADPVNGFNAVVHREPLTVAAPVVKTVAPVLPAAPVVAARFAAPAAYAAPLAYAAPVAKFAAPVAPLAYSARVAAPLAYAAPVARVAAPIAPLAYAAPVTKTIIH